MPPGFPAQGGTSDAASRYPHAPRIQGLILLIAAWVGVAAWPLHAQTESRSGSDPNPENAQPATSDQTAEDVLRALQESRPPNEALMPSQLADRAAAPGPMLLPEGTSIVEKLVRVERNAEGWRLVFESANEHPPLQLLPNATAELLIRTAAGASGETIFLVSGEVTVFQGSNHILLRSARRHSASPEQPSLDPDTDAGIREARDLPSAEDVLKALRNKRSTTDPLDPSAPAQPSNPAHANLLAGLDTAEGKTHTVGAELRRTLHPDGTILERRAGRFVEQGDRRLFVTDNDHADAATPWELLPCQATEFMMRQWSRNPHGLVFVVSGELTLFDGKNFLLPRLAMRQLASDNLRK